jgi:hypothetical protein
MNTKITFLLLLILLVILMLFYYADVESNIIILLAITVVILMTNIIYKKEYFISDMEAKADTLEAKINMLIALAKALKQPTARDTPDALIESIDYIRSCPISMQSPPDIVSFGTSDSLQQSGIQLPFGSTLNDLTPAQLLARINPPTL